MNGKVKRHLTKCASCNKVCFTFLEVRKVFQDIFFNRARLKANSAKRKECAYYRCDKAAKEVWHLTSMYNDEYAALMEIKLEHYRQQQKVKLERYAKHADKQLKAAYTKHLKQVLPKTFPILQPPPKYEWLTNMCRIWIYCGYSLVKGVGRSAYDHTETR